MRSILIPVVALTALYSVPLVVTGQDTDMTDMTDMDEAGSGLLPPTPAKVQLWTNKLGYSAGEQVDVRLTLDPMDDTTEYTMFLYRENIETGERQYIDAMTNSYALSDDLKDASGMTGDSIAASALTASDATLVWSGGISDAGLWQFVYELRSPEMTQIVKRAYAKFVVSQNQPTTYGEDGTDTEIAMDTTWTNDTIYKIKYQVFVNSGATLTIEPGTLILAKGQNAVIVIEKGGKIIAEGRREAPIVMTCDADLGQRDSGCWAGLIVLGNAPVNRTSPRAEGVVPETRPVYGGDDPMDSSGVLRYVRVEFAGVDFAPETQPNAFGFHGVGAGTVIDHIQAHEGEDDGIEFFGGTADCTYCVSSGAKDDSLDWAFGWQGTGQYIFIQQDADQGDRGIEADNDSSGSDNTPRSHPTLYNLTMVGGLTHEDVNPNVTSSDGMKLRVGTAITARNVIVTGFGGDGIDVGSGEDPSAGLFTDGTSSIMNSIVHANGGTTGGAQIVGGVASNIGYMDVDPMLVNVRYEANPDPRPMASSYALKIDASATPPSDDKQLDTSAQCIGAFCNGENWLEEWTFFGDEIDYDVD